MAEDKTKHDASALQHFDLIDFSLEPIFSWHPANGIQTWNKGCEELYGYSRHEAIGRISHELLQTRFPESLSAMLDELEREGSWKGELRHRTKSGSDVVVEGYLQMSETGGERLVMEINRNISDRKRAEAELAESRAHISAVLESVSDAVYALDADWRFTLFNRAAEAFFGRSRDEILGRRFGEVLPMVIGTVFEESYRRVMETREVLTFEARSVVNPDRFVELRVAPMDNGVVVSFSDVTARKRAEEAAVMRSAHLQLLFDVAARLLTVKDVNQFIGDIYERLESLVALDYYFYCQAHEERPGRLSLSAYKGLDSETAVRIGEIDLDEAVCGQVDTNGKPIVIERVRQSSDPRTKLIRSLDISVYAAFPLTTPSGFYGTLSFGRREERPFSSEELSLLRSVSDLLATAIERRRSEESLCESEERFRAIVSQSTAGICRTDLSGRITFANQKMCEILGCEESELIGRTIWEFTFDQDLSETREAYERVLADGESFELEERLVRKDQSLLWVNSSVAAIRDPAGVVQSTVAVVVNITERREAEEALRRSNERWQILLENVKDVAIITMDTDRLVTSWNPGATEIFGFTESEMVGRSGDILFTPEDILSGAHEWEAQTAVDRGSAQNERYHLHKSGFRPFVSGVMTAIYNNGELNGFVKIARDLTERKKMEEALKEADQRKNEFLATLAHELRNPLAPVRSGLEVINRAECDGEILQNTLKVIKRQTDQIVTLVDDLLDISRITQGKINLRKEIIALHEVIESALETSGGYIKKHNHNLTVSLPDEPVFVYGDMIRLSQVLLNLLNNAARYTPPGGSIWLDVRREGGEALVRVRDTGMGIPPHMLSHIFEMFGQAVTHDEKPQSGLGIGLSLAKKLVELHDGTIDAFSEGEGKGSEFIVTLPAREAPVKTPEAPAATEDKVERAEPRRILIVDDNADAVKMLETLLTMEGHDTRTALDGESALRIAEAFEPEVVLLDIGLPQMSGHEVARRLRERMPGILIIAISGWGQDEDRQRSREAGFDYHLVKPVEFDELDALLNRRHGDE